MDFDIYAAFALSREEHVELDCGVGEDVERTAANQVEHETMRAAKELEQLEKAKATQEFMAGTAAQLMEHRPPPQVKRVEYHVSRVGPLDRAGLLTKYAQF